MFNQYTLILVAVSIGFIFFLIISFLKRFKRCPSDSIMVVYGKIGNDANSEARSSKCIHGGAAFIWPVIQDYAFLELTPISIEINLTNALSKQNIRVDVPSRFTVGISTEGAVMNNAAERLLGLSQDDISNLAKDIIFGQLRLVVATMDIEEINSNRDKFLDAVSSNVEAELKKIGLKLINVNVTDINDESGYIEALGKEAAAKAINDAKHSVAEKNRDGEIGQAIAFQEQRVKVSDANADAKIGEAAADQKQRIQIAKAIAEAKIGEAESSQKERVQISSSQAQAKIGEAEAHKTERIQTAEANATAVDGENSSKVKVAESDASRREKEAEAERKANAAEKVSRAKALEEAYTAEKLAEISRADKEEASRQADIIVPAKIDKEKITIDAEAIANQKRAIAKGEADAIFAKMEAEGKGQFEILSKQAQGFKAMVQAAGNNPNDAVKLMIADKLPELVKSQVEAVKNLKIDKITVWDNMGSDGESPTSAKFLSGMLGSVPPFEELFKMAGMDLPEYLGKKSEQEVSSSNVVEAEVVDTEED